MKSQVQAESKLVQYQEQLESFKKNSIHKAVNREGYESEYRVLTGQIHALEWVLEIKKVRKR